jgi:hypothetical protein
VLGVLGVEPGFEETEISRRSADVLGRGEIGCRRRIWDILPRPARGCGASSFGGPAVAEIIFVEDREAIVFVIRKNKVSQPVVPTGRIRGSRDEADEGFCATDRNPTNSTTWSSPT